MFRSFVYLDEDKLYTYHRQIDGKNHAQPKAITQRKAMGVNASLSGFGVNRTVETDISSNFEKDIRFDYDRFELDLNKLDGEDYFDCVLNADYDPTTVPAMKLIRLCTRFEIPEQFDVVNLIEQFKPMLIGKIETKSSGEQEALQNILGNASADIPLIAEYDDFILAGKLNTKYLHEDYSNLEDYADQEVYILCKVVGMVRKEKVVIFDPLKDFIRLPRTARRHMISSEKPVGIDKIEVEGPVLKVEVIAIYK